MMHSVARLANMLGAVAVALADRLPTDSDSAALAVIAQYPGRTVEELRQALALSHSATVRVVDRLADGGLVRRASAGHGPALSLHATATGRRRAVRQNAQRADELKGAVSHLSAAERRALEPALETILAALTDDPLGRSICRLCEAGPCRGHDCPVELRQRELGHPPPEPTPLG